MLCIDVTDVNVYKYKHTHIYSTNVCRKVCKHARAFICMSMSWYVLLSLCLFYQPPSQNKPGEVQRELFMVLLLVSHC